MKKIVTFFCLMPIAKFDEVYFNGITSSISAAAQSSNVKCDISRADSESIRDENVMESILKNIRNRDIMIIDITGFNPNVMWELGYCKALGKTSIIISQDPYEKIPFNIRQDLIFKYKWIDNKIIIFTREFKNLSDVISKKIQVFQTRNKYLKYDGFLNQKLERFKLNIHDIRKDSVISSTIHLKIDELNQEISKAESWKISVQHESSVKNLQNLFCSVMGSLKAGDVYNTISFREFWDEATIQGADERFFQYNKSAIEEIGVKVNRIIIVDAESHKNKKIVNDEFFVQILEKHCKLSNDNPDNCIVKVIFKSDYKRILEQYRNFALIKRNFEEIVIRPLRNEKGNIIETEILMLNKHNVTHRQYEEHETKINKYKERFRSLWEDQNAAILTPNHYEIVKSTTKNN